MQPDFICNHKQFVRWYSLIFFFLIIIWQMNPNEYNNILVFVQMQKVHLVILLYLY